MEDIQLAEWATSMKKLVQNYKRYRISAAFLKKATSILISTAAFALAVQAQTERPYVDVDFYNIEAAIDLPTKMLDARVEVQFTPREQTKTVIFELHNALNVSRVEDKNGSEISVVRHSHNFTLQLHFPNTLQPEDMATVTFFYKGSLAGTHNSPVEGYDLATIEATRAYLLYPARWFPVNSYGADRFAANMQITVDRGLKVIGSQHRGKTYMRIKLHIPLNLPVRLFQEALR